NEPGEITHFQALSSALSATVGLGNIAGVAVAVSLGGPGAVFWMIVAGFFGMSSKFAECTLGVMYRTLEPSGKVLGGPVRYLSHGLKEKNWPRLGKVLAGMFAVLCLGGSLGGGNMFQANQAFAAISNVVPGLSEHAWIFGLIMVFCVGIVIIGGIRSISTTASFIVPFMCGIYIISSIIVLIVNGDKIPAAFALIFSSAFNFEAGFGGLVGVLMVGFQRAAFSNEAGIGSAAIAHSAVATKEPVREGIVALLEPFIDTIIICTMTSLVIIVSGVYDGKHGEGVNMASSAFATVMPWFPYVLAVIVFLFAYSTMISWSYYGDRCWAYFFGEKHIAVYHVIFLTFTFLGTVFSLGKVLEFSDLMVLGMALPNLIGVIVLSGKVKASLNDYWHRFSTGQMAETTKDVAIENSEEKKAAAIS
ncbi:MAG: alanine/glycine:cation symporter family protein, partial [bacterium]|nr:alanine/glycine:cation symporter family protein [bacterium]